MNERPLFPRASDPVTLTQGAVGRPPTRRRAVLDAVRGGAGTPEELARATGLRPSVVLRAIEWLALHGFVRPCRWEAA